MIKVRAYPDSVEIANGSDACISITPDKKWGREYHMGTVMLTNVRLRSYAHGEWDKANEYIEQFPPTTGMMSRLVEVNYVADEGTFYTFGSDGVSPVDLTDRTFNVVYMCGDRVFVSKESL